MDTTTWAKAHADFLVVHVHRMRLLAQRRIEALRRHGWDGDVTVPTRPSAEPDPATPRDEEALTAAVVAHEARLAEYAAELPQLGGADGITSLCHAVGLDEVEREAVTASLCAELDPTIGDLFAYLHGDPRRRWPTPALLAGLLQRDLSDVWTLLDPHRSMRRFRIVALERGAGAGGDLRLDGRVLDYLRGHNHLDESLSGLVAPLPDVPQPERFAGDVARLARWLADPQRSSGSLTVNLIGSTVECRWVFASHLIRAMGLHPLAVHLDRLAARADRGSLVPLIEREAVLLPAALYVEPVGIRDDPAAVTAAQELLEELGGLVVMGSPQRWAANRRTVVHPIDALQPSDQVELWHANLGMELPGMESVVEQFSFGPESVRDAALEAVALRELRDGEDTEQDDVWQACRRHVGRELGELAARLQTSATWDDIVLPADRLALLHEIADQVRHRARVYEDWGFGARLSRGRGISALFTGPPGTGKTMAAEILGAELDLDLYRVDLASVVSKYIGETEKNLRRVFDAAEQGGAILFFDEADALFGKRTEVKDSHDRHANFEINYLLQRMEQYAGLAILATNRKSDLDVAFLRRIRFLVAFPFPDVHDRCRIWQRVLPAETPRRALDYDVLARLELAGGNIKNIAVNGAFLAAAADEPVGMGHLMHAARQEYRKADKLPSLADFGEYYAKATP